MDVRALEFQLDQVRSQLRASPENAGLKALESKLTALIELNKETEKEAEPVAPLAPPPPPTKLIDLRIGDLCEAKKMEGENWAWWEATIQSIAADKLSCTVVFTGITDAQHCTPQMIRKHTASTKKFHLAEPKQPIKPAPNANPASKPTAIPATGPVRRKHTKAEHDQKKEAEHAAKQQSWQSFKQKIGKGTSGPFSKPPGK
jgi:hypothetical protein